MDSIVWTIDWNPDFEEEAKIKKEILKSLRSKAVMKTIKHFAEQAVKEAKESGLETEHIVWLDSNFKHAYFVRVWYEECESKLFIIIEENDLGDVGFLILHDMDCATYEEDRKPQMVEYSDKFLDPDSLGVSK
ncbi:MAG: hypothetical protein ACT4PT_11880 [Methanobacteriota archaeon]